MRAVGSIAWRETQAFFASPVGWICLLIFVCLNGLFFSVGLSQYVDYANQMAFNPNGGNNVNINEMVIQGLFGNVAVIALLVSPAITMRAIAEDRKQRSMELLLTSPISSFEIVAGKFLGIVGFIVALVISTLPYMAILYAYGEPDTGIVLCNYLNFILFLGAVSSAGLFFSACTENQIVALMLAFGFNLGIWILQWPTYVMDEGTLKTVLDSASMLSHFTEMGKGLIKLSDLTYFLTFIGFFLLATTQRVEALRWR